MEKANQSECGAFSASRRKFLARSPFAAAALAAGGCVSAEGGSAAAQKRGGVKFSLFSDLHYRVGDYNWASKRLEAILERAEKNSVDFVMECGDFCHDVVRAKPIIDRYNNFKIPTYHAVGNHDFESTKTLEAVVDAYKMTRGNFYYFDKGSLRFIVLDTNYFINKKGEFEHYAASSAWDKCHQTMAVITPPQIEMLKRAVSTAKGMCVVFSHNGIRTADPEKGITNAAEVLGIFAANPSIPILWINGHWHRNNLRLDDGIAFFTINTPTSDWLGGSHNAYPPEIMNSSPLAKREILFDVPVNAIVTVWPDGEVLIEGMKGATFMGLTPEDLGASSYSAKLPFDPNVLSAHFKLFPRVSKSNA